MLIRVTMNYSRYYFIQENRNVNFDFLWVVLLDVKPSSSSSVLMIVLVY